MALIIKCVKDLTEVVDSLKPYCLRRLVIDGIEIEFDTVTATISAPDINNLNGAEPRATSLKRELKDLLGEAEADELWST